LTEIPGAQKSLNLSTNSFLYEACLLWVSSAFRDSARCVDAAGRTAWLAGAHHPGRFADGALENWVLQIGHRQTLATSGAAAPKLELRGSSRTLHVASELHPTGGHTRVLAKWVARDASAQHAVVITRQPVAVPEFVERAVTKAGGSIFCLPPTESPMIRAGWLRDLAARVDRIVLHHHQDDPVPTLAFAQPGGPPVAMFNHAHFSFSLGATVSDIVVNTLEYFRGVSKEFRFARQTACLSGIPGLGRMPEGPIDRRTAKSALGIDPDRIISLSVGHESYYRPTESYDFFRVARRLLRMNPNMHLIVMGVSSTSPTVPVDLQTEPRCHCVGFVTDPIPYYRAADIFLESFPMPSLGAVVEAVAYGEAFPVPVYGPTESVLRISQEPILRYRHRPLDEDAYVEYVTEVAAHLDVAREEARQARQSMFSFDEAWETRLRELNQKIDTLTHESSEIPVASMVDSYDNRVLADLRTLNVGRQIDALLPLSRGALTHVRAVGRGFARPRSLGRIGHRMLRDLIGRSRPWFTNTPRKTAHDVFSGEAVPDARARASPESH